MFTAEEIESNIKKAVDSIADFRESKTKENAVEADYFISIMRLSVGKQFDELHWFLQAEKDVKHFLDKESKNRFASDIENMKVEADKLLK